MGVAPSTDAPKTVVIGASGCVGIATLEALMKNSKGELNIYAGIRDEAKFRKHMINVPTIRTDMANRRELTTNLMGFNRVFIVVPSDRNRTGLASIALDACKAAGVEFVVVLFVTIAHTPTIFGRQFRPIEERTKKLGIPYTILRLPLFMDNVMAHSSTIRAKDCIFDPRDPRKAFGSVSLLDVGKCVASILNNPEEHYNRTYNLVSEKFSMIDLAHSLKKLLRRDIKVKEINWERFKKAMQANQVPEWQTEGLIEWLRSSYDERLYAGDLANIKEITGEEPCTLNHFIMANAEGFGWTCKRDTNEKRHANEKRDTNDWDHSVKATMVY